MADRADESAEGSRAAACRSSRAAAATRRETAQIVPGFPIFVRQRHFVRGSNVYSVPLWDLTSRWLPEELKACAASAASSDTPSTASSGRTGPLGKDKFQTTREDGRETDDLDGRPGAATEGNEDRDSGSESEQSDVAWDGALGTSSRLWCRAAVDGGLMLLRRFGSKAESTDGVADVDASAGSSYGLAVSSALFPPEATAEGSDVPLDRRLVQVLRTREPMWAVCALRSGHFAGAVFKGQEAVVHKAIHRYTVRAKAGGSQSACDNTGRKVKSAGSTLRRYGEQRLAEEIRELMTEKWYAELCSCELVLVSVSKRMRSTLLGTEKEPFLPSAKVRKLPFMVGKPTFEAVKEAFLRVASVAFCDERTADALTTRFRQAPVSQPEMPALSEKPKEKQVEKPKEEPRAKYNEQEDELYTTLHEAASAGDDDLIYSLLDDGADPTARDGKGRVPYYLCPSQRARDAFRRWRGSNEEDWDWHAAQVPDAITEETDQKRKEKEKEKRKKQKEKQKVAKARSKEEEEERLTKEAEDRRLMEAAQAKCDCCKKPIINKVFTRLSYQYCDTECVNAHRRELQAEAAMKRMSGLP